MTSKQKELFRLVRQLKDIVKQLPSTSGDEFVAGEIGDAEYKIKNNDEKYIDDSIDMINHLIETYQALLDGKKTIKLEVTVDIVEQGTFSVHRVKKEIKNAVDHCCFGFGITDINLQK